MYVGASLTCRCSRLRDMIRLWDFVPHRCHAAAELCRYAARGVMRTSILISIASLLCAIAFTVAAEKRPSGSGARLAWAALFAIYGVCVGTVSTVLVYFFALGEWAALAISVPLGVPASFLAVKMSE